MFRGAGLPTTAPSGYPGSAPDWTPLAEAAGAAVPAQAISLPNYQAKRRIMKLPTTALLSMLALAASAYPQALLADINRTTGNNGSLTPSPGVMVQGLFLFTGTRWDIGRELWRTDGTPQGTYPLLDFVHGPGDGGASQFCGNDQLAFFVARSRIWRSDGTLTGTFAISQPMPHAPTLLMATAGGCAWFQGTAANWADTSLWLSDGSGLPPVEFGPVQSTESWARSGALTYFGGRQTSTGHELWVTDGTLTGTRILEVLPGNQGISPVELCSDGAGGVWFAATHPSSGRELWHSDGTLLGTRLVADLRPGSTGSGAQQLCPLFQTVFFMASGSDSHGGELWRSDGTAAGTVMVRDICPGSASSQIGVIHPVPSMGRVFFSADDGLSGREPWTSDGTAAGTFQLADIRPGASGSLLAHQGIFGNGAGFAYFRATTPNLGDELFMTDGTVAGTRLVGDLFQGTGSSDPIFLGELQGNALFRITTAVHGTELWVARPPTGFPELLGDLNPPRPNGSWVDYPSPQVAVGASLDGSLFFAARDGVAGSELWRHSGTAASCRLIEDLIAGNFGVASVLAATTTHVFYLITDSRLLNFGRLVSVDMFGQTRFLLDATSRLNGIALRDKFVFSTGGSQAQLMISDGSLAGTKLLRDIHTRGQSPAPSRFTRFGDRVLFAADDGARGNELWVTDGTKDGTELYQDLTPGSAGTVINAIFATNSRVFLRSSQDYLTTDGSAAGTVLLPGVRGSRASLMGGILLVAGDHELWRSDGTVAGTYLLLSDNNLRLVENPPCIVGDKALFALAPVGQPMELWVTDGSVAGSSRLRVIDGTRTGGIWVTMNRAGLGHCACEMTEASTGTELWVSDGTIPGTSLVHDAAPGPLPAIPRLLEGTAVANGLFTWWAEMHPHGSEPWVVPLSHFGGSNFEHYGAGCPGGAGLPHIEAGGRPVVGSSQVDLALSHANPSSFAALLLGFQRIPGPQPCVLRTSGDILVGLAVDASGRARHGFAVPNWPGLAGTKLHGQFVCMDPQGGFAGGFSSTVGLEILLGR